MVVLYILLGLAIALSILFIVFQRPKYPFISLALKGLASLAVVATAFSGFAIASDGGGGLLAFTLLCIGLAACMLGDVFLAQLEFDNARLTDRIRAFGFLAFSIAQLCFIAFFASLLGIYALYALIAGAVLAVAVYFIGKLMKLQFGKLTWVVLVYSFLVGTALGGAIVYLILAPAELIIWLLAIGLVLFLISDLVLSSIYFGAQPANRKLYYVNYAFYYAAIICISSIFVFGIGLS